MYQWPICKLNINVYIQYKNNSKYNQIAMGKKLSINEFK